MGGEARLEGRWSNGLLCRITAHREEKRRERKPEEREQSGQTTERLTHTANMPNFEGTWKIKSSMNFDELLKALGEDNLILLI